MRQTARLCTGCRFLRHATCVEVCAVLDAPSRVVRNPYTGRALVQPGGFRPTVEEMRAVEAPCGPEARLYEAVWWRRWWRTTP